MTDALGRTLEHRVVILEKRLDNIEDVRKSFLLALVKWLEETPGDRTLLRSIVEEEMKAIEDNRQREG